MTVAAAPTQLYLLTPPLLDATPLKAPLAAALDATPIACVRLRLASDAREAALAAAEALRPICHARDVAIVLEGEWRVAREAGLDGVHLAHGGHEQEAAQDGLRAALGDGAIIGVDCRASRHLGLIAAERGADYVAFGPLVEPGVADDAADRDLFAWWQEMIETPVVAEGCAAPEHAETLAGLADFIGVSERIWEHPEGAAAGVLAYSEVLRRS